MSKYPYRVLPHHCEPTPAPRWTDTLIYIVFAIIIICLGAHLGIAHQ